MRVPTVLAVRHFGSLGKAAGEMVLVQPLPGIAAFHVTVGLAQEPPEGRQGCVALVPGGEGQENGSKALLAPLRKRGVDLVAVFFAAPAGTAGADPAQITPRKAGIPSARAFWGISPHNVGCGVVGNEGPHTGGDAPSGGFRGLRVGVVSPPNGRRRSLVCVLLPSPVLPYFCHTFLSGLFGVFIVRFQWVDPFEGTRNVNHLPYTNKAAPFGCLLSLEISAGIGRK